MIGKYASDIRIYVRQRPILKRYLKEGVVNCSALAKSIAKNVYGNKSGEIAIRAALLREAKKGGDYEEIEEGALKVLRGSTLEVRTGLCVALSKNPIRVPVVVISTSKSGVMSVIEEENSKKVKTYDKIIRGVDMITICSGKDIESTPGVMALLVTTLSQEGINIVEITSCHYDTLLVVDSADTQRAFAILQGLTKKKG